MTTVSVPLVFTVEEMLHHFLEHGEPTSHQLSEALARLGRNLGPTLLADLEAEGLLAAEAAAVHVGNAWNAAEYPHRLLDQGTWRALFSLAGYTPQRRARRAPGRATSALSRVGARTPD